MTAAVAALNNVRTWDTIVMHNGERYSGDIVRLWLKELQPVDAPASPTTAKKSAASGGKKNDKHASSAAAAPPPESRQFAVNRRDMAVVNMDWTGTTWWGLVGALWRGYAGAVTVKLKDGSPAAVAALSQRIGQKGLVTAADAAASPATKAGEACVVLKAAMTNKSGRSKSLRHVEGVNHVVYRPAGTPAVTTLPLSHVASIELGHGGRFERDDAAVAA